MTTRLDPPKALLIALTALLTSRPAGASNAAIAAQESDLAPGVRIERSAPNPEAEARRRRLREWRRLYRESLEPLRRAVLDLFEGLEGSSLSSLKDRCRAVRARAGAVDRASLFPSSHVGIDRVLYGSLVRFQAAADECLAERNLGAYRLLVEARAGIDWVDRRLETELTPPVRLPGLADRDPPHRKR